MSVGWKGRSITALERDNPLILLASSDRSPIAGSLGGIPIWLVTSKQHLCVSSWVTSWPSEVDRMLGGVEG
jgi:hypothetical protein